MDELQSFRVTLTANGHDTYAARSGEHDDLVLAVALHGRCPGTCGGIREFEDFFITAIADAGVA